MEAIFLYTVVAVDPIPPDDKCQEGPVLDLSYSLLIRSFLLKLILAIALTQSRVLVALNEGAEHPYVKKMRSSDPYPRSHLLPHPDELHRLCWLT